MLLCLFYSPVACQAGRGGNLAEIAEDKSALEEIKKKRDVAVQKADEKVNITTMLYNILDHHIRKLGMTRNSTHSAQTGTQRQALPCPACRSQHTALCANHTPPHTQMWTFKTLSARCEQRATLMCARWPLQRQLMQLQQGLVVVLALAAER